MSEFIVPGDILRGLQAELRHRGFSVEEAEAYAMGDDMIVVATQASRGVAGGTVVAVFHRVAGNVMVKSATFGLEFTFRGEES